MANCKICGKPVEAAPVMHRECWEKAVSDIAEEFCNEYCRFPQEVEDEDSRQELHCDGCPMIGVLNLGL